MFSRTVVLCFLLVLATAGSLFGQAGTAVITGTVTDPTGSSIQGAKVELRDPLTNAQNLTNLLIMMMNPSPKIQQKIESGELNAEAMLTSVVESLQRAFSVLDFYREAFEE